MNNLEMRWFFGFSLMTVIFVRVLVREIRKRTVSVSTADCLRALTLEWKKLSEIKKEIEEFKSGVVHLGDLCSALQILLDAEMVEYQHTEGLMNESVALFRRKKEEGDAEVNIPRRPIGRAVSFEYA